MNNRIKIVSIAGAGISLALLYLIFLVKFLLLADWTSITEIESLVLWTFAIRALILIFLRAKNMAQPLLSIVLFSLETLFIPPLLIMYLYTKDAFYAVTMGTLLTSWIAATSLAASPYTIYSFIKNMFQSSATLRGVIPLGALEFAGLVLLAVILSAIQAPIEGLAGLGSVVILSLREQITTAGALASANDALIGGASILFYVTMLIYSSIGTTTKGQGENQVRFHYALLIPLLGTMMLFMWTSVSVIFSSNIFLVLTAPTVILAVAIWVFARAN